MRTYADMVKRGTEALLRIANEDSEPPEGVDLDSDESMAEFVVRTVLGSIGFTREERARGMADTQYRFVTEWGR